MLLVRTTIGPSAVHGIGLFTAEPVAKGRLIWHFQPGFDHKFSLADLEKMSPAAQEQVLNYAYRSKESGLYILCGDDARFFNHSAAPNVIDDPLEEGFVAAARDIAVGEELMCDYQVFDADFAHKFPAAAGI